MATVNKDILENVGNQTVGRMENIFQNISCTQQKKETYRKLEGGENDDNMFG